MVTCSKPTAMTGVIGKSRNKINDDVDDFKFIVRDIYASVWNYFRQNVISVINSALDGYIGVQAMKGFNFASLFSQRSPWTCRACTRLSQLQTRCPQKPPWYSTKARKPPRPRRGRNIVLAASGAAGVGALAFTDDVKHAYNAFERTGRVMGALAVCINE